MSDFFGDRYFPPRYFGNYWGVAVEGSMSAVLMGTSALSGTLDPVDAAETGTGHGWWRRRYWADQNVIDFDAARRLEEENQNALAFLLLVA